jgi:predicted permease
VSEPEVLLTLGITALLGSLLRYLLPDLDFVDLRQKLNRLVLAVFLPALNFKVIYGAQVDAAFWQVPVLALTGLALTVTLGMLVYALLPLDQRARGALVLAGAFGNVTYLGIPLLQGVFPGAVLQVTTTAILYEMTITPTNLVLGQALASRYGGGAAVSFGESVRRVLAMPLLWAIAAALLLNVTRTAVPGFVLGATTLLGNAVSGLMILSLGMALRIEALRDRGRQLGFLLPCVLTKLALSPLIVWAGTRVLRVAEPFAAATVLEAAMPTQLVVLIVADRFGLDTELAALAALVTTTASFFTLWVVHQMLLP